MAVKGQSEITILTHATAILLLISVGRTHELLPFLHGVPIAKLVLVLCFLTLIVYWKSYKSVTLTQITKYMLYIFSLAFISITYSAHKSESLEFVTVNMLGTILLLYLIAKTTISERVLRYYLNVIIFSATILAIAVMGLEHGDRLSVGETFDANDLALYLVTIMPFIFTRLLVSSKKVKLLLFPLVAVFLFGIILTGSRGGFLGLLTIVLTMLVQKFPKNDGNYIKRFSIKKILLISLAAIIMYQLAPDTYWDRISTMLNPSDDYNVDDERGRIAIWGQGLDMVMQYPWGVGVAVFASAQGMLMGGYYQTAHNSLIQIAGELGVLGLLLYLLLFLTVVKDLKKLSKNNSSNVPIHIKYNALGIRVGLFAFFVSSFFLSQAYSPLLYVLYILADRMVILHKNPESANDKTTA